MEGLRLGLSHMTMNLEPWGASAVSEMRRHWTCKRIFEIPHVERPLHSTSPRAGAIYAAVQRKIRPRGKMFAWDIPSQATGAWGADEGRTVTTSLADWVGVYGNTVMR